MSHDHTRVKRHCDICLAKRALPSERGSRLRLWHLYLVAPFVTSRADTLWEDFGCPPLAPWRGACYSASIACIAKLFRTRKLFSVHLLLVKSKTSSPSLWSHHEYKQLAFRYRFPAPKDVFFFCLIRYEILKNFETSRLKRQQGRGRGTPTAAAVKCVNCAQHSSHVITRN